MTTSNEAHTIVLDNIKPVAQGKVIFVTSFKGGVGKTTITAGLAGALSCLGEDVLVIDGDFGMRCMDLVLGFESASVFDLYDIITSKCTIDEAVVQSQLNPRLNFISAPLMPEEDQFSSYISTFNFPNFFHKLKQKYSIILIDSGTNRDSLYNAFSAIADEAIVVSIHQSSSIRAAEQTAITLEQYGIKKIRLIINSFRVNEAIAGTLPGIVDIIHRSSVQLGGIVPYDGQLPADQENSIIACSQLPKNKKINIKRLKLYEKALFNIANRLNGERIDLFQNIYSRRAKKKMF